MFNDDTQDSRWVSETDWDDALRNSEVMSVAQQDFEEQRRMGRLREYWQEEVENGLWPAGDTFEEFVDWWETRNEM